MANSRQTADNDRICPSTRALPPARPSLSPLPPETRVAVVLLIPSLPRFDRFSTRAHRLFHRSVSSFPRPCISSLSSILRSRSSPSSPSSTLRHVSRKRTEAPEKNPYSSTPPVVNFTVAEPRVFFLSRCEARRRDPVGPPPSFLPPSSTTMVVAAASRCSSEVLARLALRKPSLFGFSRGSSDKGGRVYTGVWGGEGLGKGEAICGDGAGQLQPHEIRGLDRRGTSLPGMCFL